MATKTTKTKKAATSAPAPVAGLVLGSRVSEKAAVLASHATSPVYTFEVGPRANKTEIKKEVAKQYKVKVVRVNIINVAGKKIFLGGKWGRRPGLKKAMVYLAPGNKIEAK